MTASSTLLHRLWRKILLRNMHFRDRHWQLDTLYRSSNPWRLAEPKELFRFEQTNALIEREFGHVGAILEVGCGEGHQSIHLAKRCDVLTGCDVSIRAVERARVRLPRGEFIVGAFDAGAFADGRRFDLVVACEVLYYVTGTTAAIDLMSKMAPGCLVTYYKTQAHRLGPLFNGQSNVHTQELRYGDDSWTAVWWRNL